MLDALTAALATAAGKALVGLSIASASVGGLAAADVVELPDLSDKPAEVTTEDQGETPVLPTESQTGQDAAEAKGDNAAIAEDKRQDDQAESETEETDAADPEANDFGQEVSDLAQDPESSGEDVSTFAREKNPGAAHRQDAGAPETAGERQDDTEARQDSETDAAADARRDADAPHGADAAEQDTPEQADDAGSQAEGRRGGPAADTES